MPKAYFMVRAVVEEALREKFDRWYSTDHLPWALKDFKAEKAWRFWSAVRGERALRRLSVRRRGKLKAAMRDEVLKPLIADFDKSWPSGVTRTRDLLTLAEERSAE